MKLLVILFSFIAICASSQTLNRLPGETAEAFVKRAFNIDELPHPVIETGEWDSTKKVIIFFKRDDEDCVGYLLTPLKNDVYATTIIDTIYDQGAQLPCTIETVFFANADKDSLREIVVMTKAEAHPPRYATQDFAGFFYAAYIYDNPEILMPAKRLYYFDKISEKLSEGFEGNTYNNQTGKLIKKEAAKYKTVASVRQALKDMGYPPVSPAKH